MNGPDEQEKRIKYTDLLANTLMLQNVVDMTAAFSEVVAESYTVTQADVAALSPSMTVTLNALVINSPDQSK